MARKKRNRSGQRDHSTIAREPAVRLTTSVRVPLYSDRRLYHPLQETAPVYSPRRDQRKLVANDVRSRSSVVRKKHVKWQAPTYFSFRVPRKVELCVRREKRREVLFALRRTGAGSRARRRRRNYWTGVSCK